MTLILSCPNILMLFLYLIDLRY